MGDRGRLSPSLVAAYLADTGGAAPRPAKERPPEPARPAAGRRKDGHAPGGRPNGLAPPATATPRGVVRARTPWNWPAIEEQSRRSR